MSQDDREQPLADIRFAVARLRGGNRRLDREQREGLWGRGFGSPLRTWLRAERARENAAYFREDISPELYPLELDRTRFSPPSPDLVELSAFGI